MSNKKYLIDLPEIMKEWNWEKNSALGLEPAALTHGSKKRAWWCCSVCSTEWFAVIGNRTRGYGCPECGKIKKKLSYQKTILKNRGSFAEQHPELLNEWDFNKNTISPYNITSSSKTKVWWICSMGHSWQDTIDHRVREKRNCPICSSDAKTSFPEQAIYFYFKQVTDAKNRINIFGKEVDIYLPDINVGIEYNGKYWHQNRVAKDNEKIEFLQNKGLTMIVVTDGSKNEIKHNCITYDKNVNFAIKSLFEIVQIQSPSIDAYRDKHLIYEQYLQFKRENSLANKYPEIASEWHPIKNGNLTPDMFDYSSNKTVWWMCSKCGREWEASINHRTSKEQFQCSYCNKKEAGFQRRGKNSFQAKPIVQCDLNDAFIKIWDCAADVERALKIKHANIAACCSGKKGAKTAGGYKWYYLYDKIIEDTTIYGAISLGIILDKDLKIYKNKNNTGEQYAI